MDNDGATKLIMGIVLYAALDLVRANKNIAKGQRIVKLNGTKKDSYILRDDCLRFFRGAWFEQLCDLDGEVIINEIEKNGRMMGMVILPERW